MILLDSSFLCAWYNESDVHATLGTFRAQRGRRLSFTDAAIVTVARRLEPALVATFDRGFDEVEGLEVVPDGGEVHEAREEKW